MKRTLIAAALVLGVHTAPAAAVPLGSGELRWAQANVFAGQCTQNNANCTFLGFTTGPPASPQGDANGRVLPEAPSTGPTVLPSSPRTASDIYTFTYPLLATGSSYDPTAKTGAIEFDGRVRFQAPAPGEQATGPQFDLTVDDPRIVLNGNAGQLFASGTNAGNGQPNSGQPYTRASPVFNLDLTNATYTQNGGTVKIDNIYPRIATTGYVFFSNYASNSADRTPPTFGTMSLTLLEAPPTVTVAPKNDLDPGGQDVTVSGTGASLSGPGLYIYLSPASSQPGDQNATGPAKFVAKETYGAGGSFSTVLRATSPFSTPGGSVDCLLVPCVVRTAAAHGNFVTDRSQDTATPITFKQVYTIPTPTPTATPTATVTVSPTPQPYTVPKQPKLTRIALTRTRVKFTLSKKARVTGTVKRQGKTVRKVNKAAKKGRNSVKIRKLKPGRYKVALKPKGGARKTRTVRIKGKKK